MYVFGVRAVARPRLKWISEMPQETLWSERYHSVTYLQFGSFRPGVGFYDSFRISNLIGSHYFDPWFNLFCLKLQILKLFYILVE